VFLVASSDSRRSWTQKKDEDGTQEVSNAEQAEGVNKIPRVLVDVPYG
jgi:hypothetical protein